MKRSSVNRVAGGGPGLMTCQSRRDVRRPEKRPRESELWRNELAQSGIGDSGSIVASMVTVPIRTRQFLVGVAFHVKHHGRTAAPLGLTGHARDRTSLTGTGHRAHSTPRQGTASEEHSTPPPLKTPVHTWAPGVAVTSPWAPCNGVNAPELQQCQDATRRSRPGSAG